MPNDKIDDKPIPKVMALSSSRDIVVKSLKSGVPGASAMFLQVISLMDAHNHELSIQEWWMLSRDHTQAICRRKLSNIL
jgi:hypothetical protein